MTDHRPSRKEERLLHGLRRRAAREESGMFLAEGVRVVEELVSSQLPIELVVLGPSLDGTARGRALARRLAGHGGVRQVTEAEIRRLAATDSPQGVLAVARTPASSFADLTIPARAVVLVLDGVQDPGNLGTLVRSADAFGVSAVLALEGTVDPWNPKSVRAGAGALFRVPIVSTPAGPALAWLKSERFAIFAAAAGGSPLVALDPPARVALVAGNEGAGISAEVMAAATQSVGVPIRGPAESLNVAVAAGILLYVLTRDG